jgi:NAD(P)-dependent dehydrogenase (short-subunit alcohol dehydrogenase family)
MELRDRVAIVTGGGSGIGEALCRRFVAEGARQVVVVDRHGDQAERVAADLGEHGEAAELDVADEPATKQLVDGVLDRHGPVDLYVANAGYGQRGGLELPNDAFERMWQVHVMAHVYGARAVLPSMIARGEGYLLTTASAAGLLTQMDSVTYAVTKHAAVGLAEWLAINHHHQGIRVSVLCPQAVRTNILGAFAGRSTTDEGPRQASGDGVLEPEQLADTVIDALREERFHVLPHPEVSTYVKRKADDVDRWLAGMRRFEDRLFGDRPRPGDWLVGDRG